MTKEDEKENCHLICLLFQKKELASTRFPNSTELVNNEATPEKSI